ncbi:hypothetical protein WA588_005854, partial [Blastocystis sp. NMH]
MSTEEAGLYSVYHRALLQTIIAKNAAKKTELEKTIIPQLNKDYQCNYSLENAVELINAKLRDLGFTISETSCDDGEIYYCFINTKVDAIAKRSALPADFLTQLQDAIEWINDDQTVDPTALCQRGNQEAIEYLLDNYWLMRYPTANGTTVIGGPRLLSELSNWLVNEIHCPECPVCMDPVIGGLSCPHACGAKLHRGCAYRTLMSMESTEDGVGKGRCPNCKELWSLDVDQLTDHGRIYRRSSRKA